MIEFAEIKASPVPNTSCCCTFFLVNHSKYGSTVGINKVTIIINVVHFDWLWCCYPYKSLIVFNLPTRLIFDFIFPVGLIVISCRWNCVRLYCRIRSSYSSLFFIFAHIKIRFLLICFLIFSKTSFLCFFVFLFLIYTWLITFICFSYCSFNYIIYCFCAFSSFYIFYVVCKRFRRFNIFAKVIESFFDFFDSFSFIVC